MLESSLAAVPFSQEAEEAVLGACLMNPDAAAPLTSLTSEHFYLLRNSYVWEAIQGLIRDGLDVDYLMVQERLKEAGRLAEVGGPAYLTGLMNSTPTSMHAPIYANLIQKAAIRRAILLAADEAKRLALDEDMPVEQALSGFTEGAARLRYELGAISATENFSDLVAQYLDYADQRMNSKDKNQLLGIPSGFRDLDELNLGDEAGNLVIIAGAPGMGKTALMLTETVNRLRLGIRVGFISLEMSKAELLRRLIAIETGIDLTRVRKGEYDVQRGEWRKVLAATDRIQHWPLFIEDRPLTIEGIAAKLTDWRESQGLDCAYVDYLQIITDSGKEGNREREVSKAAYGLKELAKSLHIPVTAGAQVNREVGKRDNKRPVLSDLRESGAIEQAADRVEFVYRDIYYNPETEFPNQADIIIAKSRNGSTGTIMLHFEKSLTRFSDKRTQTIDLSALDGRDDD